MGMQEEGIQMVEMGQKKEDDTKKKDEMTKL